MCCDGWYPGPGEEIDGECPDCGGPTVEGGSAYGCNWSPVECDTCGWAPCDGSC